MNIENPECMGASYSAHIPGSEVASANSNPSITNLPPPYICLDKPWVFNSSATDKDGDVLVYELFHPYNGLDNWCPLIKKPLNPGVTCGNGAVAPANCNYAHQPVPPPLVELQFKAPYDGTKMLNGDNIPKGIEMTINRNTGIVTATPNKEGVFVVGWKVKEYRNNILISETLRDYQLLVLPCPTATGIQSNAFGSSGEAKSFIQQNIPHPFNKETTIEFYIAQNNAKASILIYDMTSKLLKRIKLNVSGNGSVIINANDLQPGIYLYTLVINDIEVDTKRLMITP